MSILDLENMTSEQIDTNSKLNKTFSDLSSKIVSSEMSEVKPEDIVEKILKQTHKELLNLIDDSDDSSDIDENKIQEEINNEKKYHEVQYKIFRQQKMPMIGGGAHNISGGGMGGVGSGGVPNSSSSAVMI